MSNSYFTGVYNETYGKINAVRTLNLSSINAGSLKTGIINCDSLEISLPKAAIIIPNTAAYNLTDADLSLMARGDVLYQESTGSSCVFRLNAVDTAAEALRLLTLFNIPDATTTRLITLNRVNTITNNLVAIGAFFSVRTFKYVKYTLAGSSASTLQVFSTANSHRKAYILISSGLVAGTTEKTIIFDVIGKA